MYVLQEEPEKGHRIPMFLAGGFLAFVIQGGGLWAANSLQPPKAKNKNEVVEVAIVRTKPEPPPPKPPPPPPPPPKVEPEKPRPRKPRPKPRARPKPKVEPPPPAPEPPKPAAPVPIGVDMSSTVTGGGGPRFQVSNQQMGVASRRAVAPTRDAREPSRVVEAPPRPRTRAREKVIRKVEPRYTVEAKRAGIEGTIVLLLTIDERGRVVAVKIIKGLGFGLDEATLDAVRKWKYRPATVDGEPVRATRREKVRFILED